MNNSNQPNGAYPFNFSTTATTGMHASTYCQDTSKSPSSSPQGSASNSNVDQSSGQQQFPQQQQQQLGASSSGSNGGTTRMHLAQSFLQGSQKTSSTDAAPSPNGAVSDPAHSAMNLMASNSIANQESSQVWQSCRFCQQKFFVTPERLLEHEISCPMHIQVQQFLQQQQRQQQQNELQRQLQAQQNQLQQQFNAQQQQVHISSSFGLSNAFGGGIRQCMSTGNNLFQSQIQTSQSQCLNSLLQQHQSNINTMEQQSSYHQASAQAASGSLDDSPSNEDQFESAVNRLPAFEPKPLSSSFAPDAAPQDGKSGDYFPLAMPEDEEWLTPLHCFVRRYCVEIFVATSEDVAAPCMGKRNPVSVHQVGIRCPYCSPERVNSRADHAARENGVVYPSLIARIYNSSINLLQRHLRSCAFVPPEVLARYEELKSSNARSGASKKYWADSAARLGLVDTPNGIRLDRKAHEAQVAGASEGSTGGKKSGGVGYAPSLTNGGSDAPEPPPLVLPSDKRNTTAFTFHLMSQMQPCVFTEADRLGRRRGLKVGFAGLACRHCFGVYGSGRFFPSSVKTMADASKTLDVIYRHILKCKNCPSDIKGGLRNLRDFHDSERSKMPFGNQRAFFVKIWGRLHEGSRDCGVPPLNVLVPPPMPALTSMASVASNDTSMVPSLGTVAATDGMKANAAATPISNDSLQGLYAMVKRGSNSDQDSSRAHNKLTTEAA
eukprot:CAMPEP_0172550516 /NCGR_PEP_ID=MMETSP1067-20121228/30021_1 /TAXON_ID=265564 ORGANISM="Thalassiosira punctigera, Strain Tpunct2005C2" /NCGR_SAMPLE_ID=MMETSP1067 /ASSEMBLY_ACC=CAM_ASM_000444 /LENGTH=718 /DNA_ID=CAMNT_0013338121 /DNA_START=234 /DNA_END=2390 /DNA_ORIENTATION=-